MRIRVLVVDDDANGRRILMLSLNGQQDLAVVGEAADGIAAIDAARELKPDAVVMDVNMPRLDGIASCRQIHDEHPQIRVIAFSGETDAESRQQMLAAGACAFIVKGHGLAPVLNAIRFQC